ncbi:MAG: heavy metal-associated domain-containing protein [Ginsengibacter sp.]
MEKLIAHTFHVSGMSCGSCVSTVIKKLSEVPEVRFVDITLANKKLELTSTREIDIEILQEALNKTGFTLQ